MPKVNLFTNKYADIGNTIKAKSKYMGVSVEDTAAIAGVSIRTMSNRYNSPEMFTVEQLARLCKRLKIEIVINENGIHCRMERGEVR